MRTLRVQTYRIAPTFNSIRAALEHAKSYPALALAKTDEELVSGSQICDAYWTDSEFVIQFSNDRYLHIYLQGDNERSGVRWRILDDKPALQKAEMERIGADPLNLLFESGGQASMDRSAMVSARIGKDFRQFFVNELGFYVYTCRQLILCFGCVRCLDTNQDLLYVYEDD